MKPLRRYLDDECWGPGCLVFCHQCERVWIYGEDRESKMLMCRCVTTRWEIIARGAIVGAIAKWQWGDYLP